MPRLRASFARLLGLVGRQRRDLELADELSGHLDAHIADNLRAGMTPAEARRDALLKLGGIAQAQEHVRERRSFLVLDHLRQDVRYALRTLRRDRSFAVGVVLMLAAGIGLNAGIFTVINSVILRDLPLPDPGRLVIVAERTSRFETPTSWPDFVDLRQRNKSLESTATFSRVSDFTFRAGGDARNIKGTNVSLDYFATLGVTPIAGRLFAPAEAETGARVALVREDFWQTALGADAAIVGKSIVLNGATADVIGILPAWFRFPADDAVVWMPLAPRGMQADRGWHAYPMVGRLKPDVTLSQAQSDLQAVMQALAREYPDKNAGRQALVRPLQDWSLAGPVRDRLVAIQIAALVLCVMSLASVSSLFLARASTRRQEFSIRAALGASAMRQLSQHVTESIVLTIAGCGAAIGIAWAVVRGLVRLYGSHLPRAAEISPDWRLVAAVTAAAALVAATLGVLTALHQDGAALDVSLRESARATGGRRAVLTRRVLVVAQVACAVMLLSVTGEMLRSLWSLMHVDIGFERAQLLTMQINLPSGKYPQGGDIGTFFERVADRLQPLPGVAHAAAINMLPVAEWGFNGNVSVEGMPTQSRDFFAEYRWVTADYFSTVGIPLTRGRLFLSEEIVGRQKAAVINEAMARRLWGDRDPLGAHVRFLGPDWITVVGVVRDVRQSGVNIPPSPEIFVPAATYVTPLPAWSLLIRSTLPIESLMPSIRRAVQTEDVEAAIDRVKTMEDVVVDSIANQRLVTTLLVCFGCLALGLAVLAVYSIVAYAAAARAPELAIRAALGADSSTLIGLVGRQGLVLVAIGITAGVAATVPASVALASMLFGISRISAAAFAGASALLLLAGVLATLIPAARTVRIDPMRALRQE
jgi:predicted permease